MLRGGRVWLWLLPLVVLGSAGCANDGSHNPSLRQYLLHSEESDGAHAKLTGRASSADPDPGAPCIEVRPLGSTCSPVGTHLVVIATVRDTDGKPLRHRRVEWMLEGAGHIIKVDESGFFAAGYKVDSRDAVSYTDVFRHTISRSTGRPKDDFDVEPGQTWCVVSAAAEGDAQLTVYAPGIDNWEKNRSVVNLRWVNAHWNYPAPLTGRSGSEQILTTSIEQHSDKQPLSGYKVRYKILDGPPAVLLPNQTRDAVAVTDLSGFASVGIRQVSPVLGRNRVLVQIVKPPDPRAPGVAPVVLEEREASVEWQAPDVVLLPETPPNMTVGRETSYALNLRNNGPVAAQTLTVRTQLPEGVEFVRSDPPALVDGPELVWTLGELGGKAERKLLVTVKPLRIGTLTGRARLLTSEGQRDEKEVTTEGQPPPLPRLEIKIDGPATALTGPPAGGGTPLPVVCRVTLSNPGTGPASNVVLRAAFTPNLRHHTGQDPVELAVGTVAAGASVPLSLTLTPIQAGAAAVNISAEGDDRQRARAEHHVQIEEAGLTLTMQGPQDGLVGLSLKDYALTAKNVGQLPLREVVLRDQLPAEVTFNAASDGGRLTGNEVVWALGELKPGESKTVRLTMTAARPTPKSQNLASVVATAGDGLTKATLQARAETPLSIKGLPQIKVITVPPPPLQVGERQQYLVEVLNNGTAVEERVAVTIKTSESLKIVSATGPLPGKFDAAHVEYPSTPSLLPQTKLTYTLTVEGAKAGDGRLRVEVSGASLGQTPQLKEDHVTVR
jgi:uncharacterized repeat protein (TIGR01451 family)